jgi:acyl-CoA hydrolase
MGKTVFIAASRRARQAVVMAASERVDFHVSVKVVQFVELETGSSALDAAP